jgi:hypothetical protein
MTFSDYLFGTFVAIPLAAISIIIIVACYALPFWLIYCYCAAHRGN